MLSLPPSVKVFAAVGPVDMRKGVDALASVVRHVIRQEPMSNHLFVFRGRRGHMLRVLFWDRNGWALYSKRLVVGNFHLPVEVAEGTQRAEVDAAELIRPTTPASASSGRVHAVKGAGHARRRSAWAHVGHPRRW